MDASQAIAFVEQNYPQYPQQQKYIIAQYVMQRASALKQQQAQQQLAEDSGGGSVAGGIAGAVLPYATYYGLEHLLASPGVTDTVLTQIPNIAPELIAPTVDTVPLVTEGASQVVLNGGAGTTATTAVEAGGIVGGGDGVTTASQGLDPTMTNLYGAAMMLALRYGSEAFGKHVMPRIGKHVFGMKENTIDRDNQSILASPYVASALSNIPSERQEEAVALAKRLGLLTNTVTKTEEDARITDWSKGGTHNTPGFHIGSLAGAGNKEDPYDRRMAPLREKLFEASRRGDIAYLAENIPNKSLRERYRDYLGFLNSGQLNPESDSTKRYLALQTVNPVLNKGSQIPISNIQGQAPTMTPYQPPANLQALANSPGNRVGYQQQPQGGNMQGLPPAQNRLLSGQPAAPANQAMGWTNVQGLPPAQQLQSYYEGAPAGNYRAPDGVNTYTVTPDGQVRQTLIGVLTPEQQQSLRPQITQAMDRASQSQGGNMQGLPPAQNRLFSGQPASSAQQPAYQPPKVMNYQEYLNSRQPNYWENKAQNMSASAKSAYGMLQSIGGQNSLNQTDYLNYAAGQMQGGLALANQPQSAPVPPGGVGGPGYKPDPNRPGHFIRR